MTVPATRLTLVAPDDWYRLPLTDEAALQRAVDAVVTRQFRGTDDQPVLRRQSAAALQDRARQARDNGGVDMYLSTEFVSGMPLALSLVVSLVPRPPAGDSLRALARGLDDDDARAVLVDLPSGQAVRRQRVGTLDLGEVDATGAQDVLLVDYSFLGPGDTLLLLSFSSPLVPVADALAELFEAVASTVRWSE